MSQFGYGPDSESGVHAEALDDRYGVLKSRTPFDPARGKNHSLDTTSSGSACLWLGGTSPAVPSTAPPGSTLSGLYLSHGIRSGSLLPELLGEPDENSFGTADVA